MTQATIGHRIIELEETDSTNTYLKNHPELQKIHGLVVTAKRQTAGRGRQGRSFFTAAEESLAFSVVIHSTLKPEENGVWALSAGVAVLYGLKNYTDRKLELKWPNDVLIEGRKVCGILIESALVVGQSQPVFVVGIGVNVLGSSANFPAEIRSTAITLQEVATQPAQPTALFQAIINEFNQQVTLIEQKGMDSLLNQWKTLSNFKGKAVRYQIQNVWKSGKMRDLNQEGHLIIQSEDGTLHTHMAGDVEYI